METDISSNGQQSESSLNTNGEERAKIGRRVVYFALCIIGIIGVTAISVAIYVPTGEDAVVSKQRFDLVKDILSALLPVLGTWVGTVLAFYFSKENFIAAAKQTSDLVRQLTPEQKLQSISVSEVMISMIDQNTIKLIIDKSDNDFNLKADLVDSLFNKSGKNRLPCVDAAGNVIYIIHRSIIDKFISEQALIGKNKVTDLTLKDLFDNDQYKQIATAFGTVNMSAKLNAVKLLMDGNTDCSDVFVTIDGTKRSKVLGWITNVILVEQSKV